MDDGRRPVSADSEKNLIRKKQGRSETVPQKASGDSKEAMNELLCSDSPEDHRKAYEMASRNIDAEWGKNAAFRMAYSGVGTERDTQKAKKIMFSGTVADRRKANASFLFTVNPSVFDSKKVVLCGTPEEIGILFCVCAQYCVRPDYYKTDAGAEIPEFMGTECPNSREPKCYIMFASAKGKYTKSTKCFYYHPSEEDFVPDSSSLLVIDGRIDATDPEIRAEGELGSRLARILAARHCSGERCEVVAPDAGFFRKAAKISDFAGPVFIDLRLANEAGLYVTVVDRRISSVVSLAAIGYRYALGRTVYEKIRARGGKAIMCSYPHMGDNFRWLCRYEGLDYSDTTFVVTENSADIPKLLGVPGAIISSEDSTNLRTYMSMNEYPDPDFSIVPFRPCYPGISYTSDYDTNCFTGIAKKAKEPGLAGMRTEDNAVPKRCAYVRSHKILLNPYGNSIQHRSDEEKERGARIMAALARMMDSAGYDVYTNAPFPSQKPLPHTKRYGAPIEQTANEACSFDLVVSVFTGFMEVMIPTGCSMAVLTYSSRDSRKSLASRYGLDNYWEFNVLATEPIAVVRKIMRIARKISGKIEPPVPVPSVLMTLKERAEPFSGRKISPRLVSQLAACACKKEILDAAEEGSDDPLICCVIAKGLASRFSEPDLKAAAGWYRKAAASGVRWASDSASSLDEGSDPVGRRKKADHVDPDGKEAGDEDGL